MSEEFTVERCRQRIAFWRGMALEDDWKETAAERIAVWELRLAEIELPSEPPEAA